MVVTRKTVTPMPPVSSRTNSSQPIPRPSKLKAPQTVPSPLVNGEPQTSGSDESEEGGPSQSNSLSKGSKSKRRELKKGGKTLKDKTNLYFDLLIILFPFILFIYTLVVCPHDAALDKLVCRSLFQYRRIILEPYFISPVRTALAHPSIAPGIEYIQPHIDHIITTAAPIVLRTQTEWNTRVVPRWNKQIVPRWNKHIVPQWARAQRRQFVDPHVARIWEKVKELSRGKTNPPVISSFTDAIQPLVSDEVFAEPELSGTASSATSFPLSDEVSAEPQLSGIASSATPVPSLDEVLPKSEPSGTAAPDDEDSEVDLTSFYADIGLDVSGDEPDSTTPIAPASSQEIETEEEKAERLRLVAEKTAKKRAEILARHVTWEEQLETQIKNNTKELRKALVALRKSAVAELKESAEIWAQVEGFVEEAEKFLKGAEVYLKNMKKEKRKDEEKISLWERVIGKVETKFSEKLREIENSVNEWYTGILGREIQAVQDALLPVRLLAEKAQADLGLDYAWLDDVTYQDWQRYHALVGKSEDFLDQAKSIQNGSHPSPPVNPIVPALADLQSEVQDIVVGFETRLRRIKRSGERAFGAADSQEELSTEEEPQVSILPVPGDPGVQEGAEFNIPSVIIGRSKQEVLQAMERAESLGEPQLLRPDGSREDWEEGKVLQADAVEAADAHEEL